MIKNYGQMQNTLKNYDMKNWSKSVEVGNRIDFKNQPFNPEVGQTSETKTFGDFFWSIRWQKLIIFKPTPIQRWKR